MTTRAVSHSKPRACGLLRPSALDDALATAPPTRRGPMRRAADARWKSEVPEKRAGDAPSKGLLGGLWAAVALSWIACWAVGLALEGAGIGVPAWTLALIWAPLTFV